MFPVLRHEQHIHSLQPLHDQRPRGQAAETNSSSMHIWPALGHDAVIYFRYWVTSMGSLVTRDSFPSLTLSK